MNVKELRDELSKYPDDYVVCDVQLDSEFDNHYYIRTLKCVLNDEDKRIYLAVDKLIQYLEDK